MTTVIFLEQSLNITGVTDATDQLVNYHVHAVKARFAWEMEERIVAFKPVDLVERMTGHWPLAEYQAIIKRLDAEYSLWSIRDDRVLFFLDQLAKMVKEARVLWVDLGHSRTEAQKELQQRTRKVFDGYGGPKLHLTEDDPKKALAFVLGEDEPVKEKKS